jgi:hypothetical protein
VVALLPQAPALRLYVPQCVMKWYGAVQASAHLEKDNGFGCSLLHVCICMRACLLTAACPSHPTLTLSVTPISVALVDLYVAGISSSSSSSPSSSSSCSPSTSPWWSLHHLHHSTLAIVRGTKAPSSLPTEAPLLSKHNAVYRTLSSTYHTHPPLALQTPLHTRAHSRHTHTHTHACTNSTTPPRSAQARRLIPRRGAGV